MDPRMRNLDHFMAGCCLALGAYAYACSDRVAAFLWCACAVTFAAFSFRDR